MIKVAQIKIKGLEILIKKQNMFVVQPLRLCSWPYNFCVSVMCLDPILDVPPIGGDLLIKVVSNEDGGLAWISGFYLDQNDQLIFIRNHLKIGRAHV